MLAALPLDAHPAIFHAWRPWPRPESSIDFLRSSRLDLPRTPSPRPGASRTTACLGRAMPKLAREPPPPLTQQSDNIAPADITPRRRGGDNPIFDSHT